MDLRLDDPDPRIRDLAYLLFLEALLGPEWVERWARERGKLDALREWRKWRGQRPSTHKRSRWAVARGDLPAGRPRSAILHAGLGPAYFWYGGHDRGS